MNRAVPEVLPPPTECLENLWLSGNLPDTLALKRHFVAGGLLKAEDVLTIIRRTTELLRVEPNVLEIESPVTICGDIHGQYYDLMTLFDLGGSPSVNTYLFLGDYVDRGCFSTEVTLLLYAYKICRPNHVFLLRGNHECRQLTTYFNFREECLHKYSIDVYHAFQVSFDCLPLAAVLDKAFLCVHGGISPDLKCVDDISLIHRFVEPPNAGPMCDILWADPMEEEEEAMCPDALFLHNELRGCSYVFSSHAASRFLADNHLHGIIRAHEAQDEGFRMYQKVHDTGFPAVMCIFSAPNYCDSYDNKAAILQVHGKVLQIKQYHSVEHPYVLPNFMNAFSWSLPFMTERTAEAMRAIADKPATCSMWYGRGRVIRAKVQAVAHFVRRLAQSRKRRHK